MPIILKREGKGRYSFNLVEDGLQLRHMKELDWETLTPEEKKKQLFLKQKHTLDLFLERNAISKEQYKKSLGDLIENMVMQGVTE